MRYLFIFFILSTGFSPLTIAMNMDKNQNMDGKKATGMLSDEAKAEQKKGFKDLREKGYLDNPDSLSYCAYALHEMRSRNREARRKGYPANISTLGFARMGDDDDRQYEGVSMNRIPSSIRRRGSHDYVMPNGDTMRRIYLDSEFGELLIRESLGTMRVIRPNLTIAGHPAKWLIARHANDTWSTSVHAADGDKVYHIESGRKLTGKKLDSFLQFAREFVENG